MTVCGLIQAGPLILIKTLGTLGLGDEGLLHSIESLGIDMMGKSIDEIAVGDTAEFTKTVTESDVYVYAGVTGDLNPAHVDEIYSRKTVFKTRIAHGMLLAGFISAVLGNKLPGPGTIYVKQDLRFLAPVPIGNTVTARVEVTGIDVEKNRLTLKTTCVNQDDVIVVDGQAQVMPPKKSKQ